MWEKAFLIPLSAYDAIRVRLVVDQCEIVDVVLQYGTFAEYS